MSAEDRPRIWADILGEKIEVILPGQGWTFDEAKHAKSVSEGMTPVQIENVLLEGDPDAWLAVLRISYLRADKEFPRKLGGEDVLDLVEQVTKSVREASKSIPPTKASTSDVLADDEKSESAETSQS